jgi:hypothetical protein
VVLFLLLWKHAESFLRAPSLRCRPSKLLVVWKASSSDNNDDDSNLTSLLSKRIQELREKEQREQENFSNGLSNRVKEVTNSQELQLLLETTVLQRSLELPVVSFDALLPGQYLEGRTDDPTFLSFLGNLGLGGWFVMISTSPKARKQRRHGVLAKIQAVDYDNTNPRVRIPTAVDFEIVGHSRCRLVGPRRNMQQRIGRWRWAYDPNGEEAMLGWGNERFLDAPDELKLKDDESTLVQEEETHKTALACSTEWSSVLVDVQLGGDSNPTDEEKEDCDSMDAKMKHSLIPMVDEWYQLASNADTYNNVNVTASTRIRKGHPGLWVDPNALLKRVLKQLGPRPDNDHTAFCFWAAALINPLPSLGVSLEIRGQMLEAPTIQRRMEILEMGLRRSIDNLKGTRPL